MPTNSNTASDAEIIRRIIAGDVNAFELILKRYQGHVLSIVKKHIPEERIEETVHDSFVRAYQSLRSFRNSDSFKYWLSSIAVRTCYDFWRNRYRTREVPMSSLSEGQQNWLENMVSDRSGQSYKEREIKQEAKETLDWALGKLSAEDRMVVELVFLEGLSGREAAELLGWSVANVKVRSFRSRNKLRNLLSKALGKKN
ncbi:MAG TPA: RNA polymerase sigma factor [Desulfobacteraceae bacterium]|nr:RNA polymerase sigma factor [Desulfobacteraceae bacterium]HPJ66647.1 RNA polymerase sigma factor [Desulfobacteraceae bacterium]HPQ27766.1 RNA polymerase sigma factor [Desulfobacteraceae bacterium]